MHGPFFLSYLLGAWSGAAVIVEPEIIHTTELGSFIKLCSWNSRNEPTAVLQLMYCSNGKVLHCE